MNTIKIYKGVFWIPNESNNPKNGILKFLKERAFVDLFDSFDKDPFNIETSILPRTKICYIYGILENGKCCVLYKCKLSPKNPSGLVGTIINFNYIFYSLNRDLIEKQLVFEKIEFKFNTLFHWGGLNSIVSFNNGNNSYGLNYIEDNDDDFIFSNDKYELKLGHATSFPITTNQKKLLIEQDSSLILKLKSNEDVFESFKFIENIHDLFILFHADNVKINNEYQFSISENDEYIYCFSNNTRHSKSKFFQSPEFSNLFTFIELKELTNVNELFAKWLTLYETFHYPIELITSSLSGVSMNSQHKFMNLIYALEYLVVKDLDNENAKVYYANVDEVILKEIEEIIQNSNLINKNNFLNKLKKRLSKNRKLTDKIECFFIQLNLPIQELFKEELQIFVEKIVNTRNHFAHVNNKNPRIENQELVFYNIKLEAIIIFIFYLKLGLPLDKIKSKLKMHYRFIDKLNS